MSSRTTMAGAAWFLFGTIASAQVDNGNIKGFISDDSGAPLSGVTVTATSAALMGTRTATSDQQGYYRVLDLPPGQYQLEAHVDGFARVERHDLIIQAWLSVQLDLTMTIGDLTEVVEVRDDPPLLETGKAMLTVKLEGDFLRALPLGAGHDWQDALMVAPGVLLRGGAADQAETHGAALSSNVFLLDGIDISEPQTNTSFGTSLPPDSVAEVRITTSGHDAASRMGGGSVRGRHPFGR